MKICKKLQKLQMRVAYYAGNGLSYLLPNALFRLSGKDYLASLNEEQRKEVKRRVDYYCKDGLTQLTDAYLPGHGVDRSELVTVGGFHFPLRKKHRFSTYFFDIYPIVRRFSSKLKFRYYFGDCDFVTEEPTLVKSRPITEGNDNSVVMKMDSMRHFNFITDSISYEEKQDKLVFRNYCTQPHRFLFLEKCFGSEYVNAHSINDIEGHPEWKGDFMSMEEQLTYKFVCCIEGNDVATNLKWVMSSNSIAVMPKPRFETWYMEGTLIPDYHYIEVKKDYSDVEEKLKFYIAHPDKAKAIIQHAHEYVEQFKNKRLERITHLCVAQKYFDLVN